MEQQEIINTLSIKFLNGIGDVNGRKLIEFFGGAGEVLRQERSGLRKVPGIGRAVSAKIDFTTARNLAEKEMEYAEKNAVEICCFGHPDYPLMLRHCHDAPLVLFKKGKVEWNSEKVLSLVGTRMMTPYGRGFIQKFIKEVKVYNPLIVSGLAYGVDVCAHQRALAEGLSTLGVLAHGLDRLYPAVHRSTAEKMMEKGGLLTEFPSGTRPEKENFVRRNRLIAGLSEATIVVESGQKGGSLITADLALSYHREVFAVPGRANDAFSRGCNQLIRENKAGLISCFADLERALSWTSEKKPTQQQRLFVELDELEQKLYDHLGERGDTDLDLLCIHCELSLPEASSILLGMELKGLVCRMPGNRYKIL